MRINHPNKSTGINQNMEAKKPMFKLCNIQDNLNQTPSKRFNATTTLKNQLFNTKQEELPIKDIVSYASTLFDLKEYKKCSFVLKTYAKPKYQTAMFLYNFCEYNLIEQKKQEEMLDTSEIGSKTFNSRDYVKLQQSLEPYYEKEELNAFNIYLYAIILKELQLFDLCKSALIKCLNLFPFVWSAWIDLSLITKQCEMVKSI